MKKGIFVIHWENTIFPRGHKLFSFGIFEDVKDKLEKAWINLSGSEFQGIGLETHNFYELILSDSTVHGSCMIPVMNINRLSLQRVVFNGSFHCASKSREVDARQAIFHKDFSFASVVSERIHFGGCRFKKSCVFHGSAGQPFGGDNVDEFRVVGFDNSIFEKPDQTIFKDVDLTKASFKSVSLVGVRFYNTEFYQEELGRNGLLDDVKEHSKQKQKQNSSSKLDRHAKKRYSYIVHEYRQLRMAMESSKDYEKSHDFYFGEMEARQKVKRNIIICIYNISSKYGTSYKRAFGFLFGMFALHFLMTIAISTNMQVMKLFDPQYTWAVIDRIGELALHSFSTGTLQKAKVMVSVSDWQNFFDIVFRLLIPAQGAMFALAVRNKAKR